MLRSLVLISCCLFAGFSLFGLLASRPWGWSEYASPELYVVYNQDEGYRHPYFIVNADASSPGQPLISSGGAITGMDCSPDGRTLAFLTRETHLYVLDQSGLLYDTPLTQSYSVVHVANNGMVVLFQPYGDGLLVDSRSIHILVPPDYQNYDPIKISSAQFLLERTNARGVEMVSPTGKVTDFSPGSSLPRWLASEQMFTFFDFGDFGLRQYLADPARGTSVRLSRGILAGFLSPDGTRRVFNLNDRVEQHVYITDALSDQDVHELTPGGNNFFTAVCFLAFRPEMLIAEADG